MGDEFAAMRTLLADGRCLCSSAATDWEGVAALLDRLAAAEAKVARVKALAEEWRYKGEFGWGAWQEGHGPDQEGCILDEASAQLRAALDPTGGDS